MNSDIINIPIPDEYTSLENIFLVPSYTLGKKIQQNLKSNSCTLKTGPLIADCFQPNLFVKKDSEHKQSALFSPFMGSTSISLILDIILTKNKCINVVFIGSTCGITEDLNQIDYKSSYTPESFYVEQLDNQFVKVDCESEISSRKEFACLSTNFPLLENIEKCSYLYNELGISLIDMECSFVKEICSRHAVNFYPYLYLSDVWDLGQNKHSFLPSPFKSKHILCNIYNNISCFI